MKCAFCGREIPENIEQRACGLCPGGCRNIHCPYCGYKNPLPPKLLKKWLEGGKDKKDKNGKESS
ncbi:hypothetical protein GSUB_11115 [Geoalkalibacter subterraneus]|jgi:DNA-directed RNA polymerase subunit RPC12/RpoP|uniref:Uncharacterized protein n=1 Tax=Geoalkalibacter subterraneus TaxID=483547 RepID=A0A0B5FTN7_9BACT|nr:hypothetical protein GSUB_11115 [Geoalkalibacter subterraneus]